MRRAAAWEPSTVRRQLSITCAGPAAVSYLDQYSHITPEALLLLRWLLIETCWKLGYVRTSLKSLRLQNCLICLNLSSHVLPFIARLTVLLGLTGPYRALLGFEVRTNWLRNRHYNLENQCHWLCMQTEAPLVGGACSSIWLDTGHTPVSGSADRSQPRHEQRHEYVTHRHAIFPHLKVLLTNLETESSSL